MNIPTDKNPKLSRLLRAKRLRHMAFVEAAALIANKASAMDLNDDLTPEDEHYIRGWLRDDIPKMLRKKLEKDESARTE